MSNKKIRNIVIAIIAPVLIVGILFFVLVCKFFKAGSEVVIDTTDINEFGGWDSLVNREEYTEYFSHLLGFPDDVEDIMVEEYRYREQNCLLDTTYYIFLRYTMSEDKFQAEKERLAGISMSYKGEEQLPIYLEDVYEHPVYVLSYETGRTYEYVILNDDANEIVSVFVQMAGLTDGIIPQEYVLDSAKILERVPDRYNMYYFDDGEGSSVMPNLEGTEVEKGRIG